MNRRNFFQSIIGVAGIGLLAKIGIQFDEPEPIVRHTVQFSDISEAQRAHIRETVRQIREHDSPMWVIFNKK